MIYRIYNGIEILIDDEDCERIQRVLYKNSHWHFNKETSQVNGWCLINNIKKIYTLSRVIMNCHEYGLDVDHKNHNHLDFRKSELRVCTPQQNSQNRRIRNDNTSGHKGVRLRKDSGKWEARISINIPWKIKTKRLQLGNFETYEEACKVYQEACIKYHGEYSKL